MARRKAPPFDQLLTGTGRRFLKAPVRASWRLLQPSRNSPTRVVTPVSDPAADELNVGISLNFA
jgi:hypothetical protein